MKLFRHGVLVLALGLLSLAAWAQRPMRSNFTPEEFARFLKEDTRRWTELIKASGIRVEQ